MASSSCQRKLFAILTPFEGPPTTEVVAIEPVLTNADVLEDVWEIIKLSDGALIATSELGSTLTWGSVSDLARIDGRASVRVECVTIKNEGKQGDNESCNGNTHLEIR